MHYVNDSLSSLTFITLWANSADDKFMNCFLIFSHKTSFDISRKLLISTEDNLHRKSNADKVTEEKYFKMSSAENFIQSTYKPKTFICQNKLIVVWK